MSGIVPFESIQHASVESPQHVLGAAKRRVWMYIHSDATISDTEQFYLPLGDTITFDIRVIPALPGAQDITPPTGTIQLYKTEFVIGDELIATDLIGEAELVDQAIVSGVAEAWGRGIEWTPELADYPPPYAPLYVLAVFPGSSRYIASETTHPPDYGDGRLWGIVYHVGP